MSKVPAFTRAVADDVERFRAMRPEERLALFFQLCDLTDSVVNARPNSDRLRSPNRRSAEAEALWRRIARVSGRGG